jgi:hypothetical protein
MIFQTNKKSQNTMESQSKLKPLNKLAQYNKSNNKQGYEES